MGVGVHSFGDDAKNNQSTAAHHIHTHINTHSILAPPPVEWALTGVFTIELLLRYYVAEDRYVHMYMYLYI